MNTCFFSPEGAWFSLWIFTPSPAGLMQGLNVVLRVLFILVFSNLLTLTTAPMELTGAIELLLSPLGLLKIPVGQVAMILSVAIQFVPTLFEETDMIRKAQTARGAKFDSPRLLDKAGAAAPLVVPIFLQAGGRIGPGYGGPGLPHRCAFPAGPQALCHMAGRRRTCMLLPAVGGSDFIPVKEK